MRGGRAPGGATVGMVVAGGVGAGAAWGLSPQEPGVLVPPLLVAAVAVALLWWRERAAARRAAVVAHEARSACAAIAAATHALTRYPDLPADTRESVAAALASEITRLHRLLDPAGPAPAVALPGPGDPALPTGTGAVGGRRRVHRLRPRGAHALGTGGGFAVEAVVRAAAAVERVRGTVVEVEVAPELRAGGGAQVLADALRALLDNARLHAPGPVVVRGGWEGGEVVVRVEDRGPGIPAERRRAVLRRGVHDPAAGGSGLGLWLTAEAVRRAGGRLWFEDRDPGTSVAVALPAPGVAAPA